MLEQNKIRVHLSASSLPLAKFILYIKLTRPGHWSKNIFILPGFLIAYIATTNHSNIIMQNFLIGCISICLITSANYVINEWLDREFDKYHPTKKMRPSVGANLDSRVIFIEYNMFACCGLGLAWLISLSYFIVSLTLLIMGMIYNIKPARTKDVPYFDVISESVNNPIRLILGWLMVTDAIFPPTSLLLCYWMGGAFLMSVKRFAELRFINDQEIAGKYRKSFQFYTPETLQVSALFYAVTAAFFGGVFLAKYKVELIYAFPFYAILFAWYYKIGLKLNSVAQHPEKIYQEKYFSMYVILVAALTVALFFIRIPLESILN